MTVFSDLLSDVYAVTNRPDLVADTKLAVRTATLKAHRSDFYPKDLFETGLTFSVPAILSEFEYRTAIPRWRALKYIRHFDLTSDTPGDFIQILDPTDVLDSYQIQRQNVAYLAGELLKIRTPAELSYALLGCYVHPITAEDTYSSWIAVEYPDLIIFEAAGSIFKMIGFDEQATFYRQESATLLTEMRNSNILATGA